MEPTVTLRSQLRRKVGEPIPEGGSDEDTMFSDARIDELLQESNSLNQAIVSGWEDKLAQWASLVDVTDGAASRKLGQLIEAGNSQLKYYLGKVNQGPNDSLSRTRTRVGRIVRPL